jgi:hypothetical protein
MRLSSGMVDEIIECFVKEDDVLEVSVFAIAQGYHPDDEDDPACQIDDAEEKELDAVTVFIEWLNREVFKGKDLLMMAIACRSTSWRFRSDPIGAT